MGEGVETLGRNRLSTRPAGSVTAILDGGQSLIHLGQRLLAAMGEGRTDVVHLSLACLDMSEMELSRGLQAAAQLVEHDVVD